MEFAEPDSKAVPADNMTNVLRSKGAGAIAYPAIDVITTRAKNIILNSISIKIEDVLTCQSNLRKHQVVFKSSINVL